MTEIEQINGITSGRVQDLPPHLQGSAYATKSAGSKGLLATFLGSTLAFYLLTAKVILKYRRYALQGNLDMYAWMDSSHEWTEAIEACGGSLQIEGTHILKGIREPVVFVGNHMSTAETFLLPGVIVPFTPLTFVIKKPLLSMPFFGPIMTATSPIAVSRDNGRADLKTVLNQGCENLAAGISIMIFPQSTRSDSFDPTKFNSLGAKLAHRAKVPIIPLAVKTDFWGNGNLVKELGRIDPKKPVRLCFGPVIPAGTDAKTAQEQIVTHVTSSLSRWGIPC